MLRNILQRWQVKKRGKKIESEWHNRVIAVIGSPIEHSLSPLMQNAAIDAAGINYIYIALHVKTGSSQRGSWRHKSYEFFRS